MCRSIVDTLTGVCDGSGSLRGGRGRGEGRRYREVARARGVSKSWVGKPVGGFRAGGYPAIEPRSRAARHIRVSAPPGQSRPSAPTWKGLPPGSTRRAILWAETLG